MVVVRGSILLEVIPVVMGIISAKLVNQVPLVVCHHYAVLLWGRFVILPTEFADVLVLIRRHH